MDKSVVAALIIGPLSFVGGLATVALTNYFGRSRDREADWRKVKLETYREYFTAWSEAKLRAHDVAARCRYLNAANQLTLVASGRVLRAFYPFQEASTSMTSIPSPTQEQLANLKDLGNAFIRAIREDSHPLSPEDTLSLNFTIYVLPQEMMTEKKTVEVS